MKQLEKAKITPRRRKWTVGIVGGTVLLGVGGWLLVHYFGDKPELPPLPPEQMAAIGEAVIQPQAMSVPQKQGVLNSLSNVSTNLKASVIRTATRKSIDELRSNFQGLKTMEEKKAKVREIISDIDRNYTFNDTTAKIFNQEFIATAMGVYMKEVSAEERALYDPIIHEFIRKLNHRQTGK